MPAAAVIPAPVVSMMNVAVKKSVVECEPYVLIRPLFKDGLGCMVRRKQGTRGIG